MLNEHGIENQILMALSQHGCVMFRSNAGKIKMPDGRVVMLAPKGWPDLSGVHLATGHFVGIEVKTDKGRLSKGQINYQENVVAKSPFMIYGVARSPEQAIEILENKLKEINGE